MSSTTTLWYVTRGSGVVALVLLTGAVLGGVLSSLRVRTALWPRFAVGTLHRNLSLLAVVFLVLHVVTTIADGYAPIGLKDAFIPFVSPYRPVWLGLGAVACDLLLALVVTSYLRRLIGARMWRGVHWLAYACWPVAVVHSLGTGSDARTGWLVVAGGVCLALVALAAAGRLAAGGGHPQVRVGGAVAAVVIPVAIILWYQGGPAHRGWARRAGTPTHLLGGGHRVQVTDTTASQPAPPGSFSSYARGTIRQVQTASGGVRVIIKLRLGGSPGGALRVDLSGLPSGGGVSMTASGVSFVPATTRAVYLGSVTALDGTRVGAVVRDAAGDRLRLGLDLTLDAAGGTASAMVDAAAVGGGGQG